MNGKAAGEAIKQGGLSSYTLALFASASDTQEGRKLTRRWKILFAKYANLSKRYWGSAKELQALRMNPSEIEDRYEALDSQFDEVNEQLHALYADLEEWFDGVEI
jgi:chromosome segregation ATPase